MLIRTHKRPKQKSYIIPKYVHSYCFIRGRLKLKRYMFKSITDVIILSI